MVAQTKKPQQRSLPFLYIPQIRLRALKIKARAPGEREKMTFCQRKCQSSAPSHTHHCSLKNYITSKTRFTWSSLTNDVRLSRLRVTCHFWASPLKRSHSLFTHSRTVHISLLTIVRVEKTLTRSHVSRFLAIRCSGSKRTPQIECYHPWNLSWCPLRSHKVKSFGSSTKSEPSLHRW